MATNGNYPSTDDEKEALREALSSGPRYIVSSEITVVVPDEDQLRREALAKINSVRFDDPATADRMRASVGSNTAEALSFLANHDVFADVANAHVRSANFTVHPHTEST
jgi:hypothetical protein